MWRARQWRQLLNVVDHLPSSSHFTEARLRDREIARPAKARTGNGEPDQRFTEWSPERTTLADIYDAIRGLAWLMAGGEGPKPKPYPRPTSAAELLEVEAEKQAGDDAMAWLLGQIAPHMLTDT